MNCHETRELLSGLVDGALTPEEQRGVDSHLAECADCRKEHERFSATITLLRRMERPRPPVGFVDRVLASVQPAPWHRSTRYPATPTLSVAAPHERSISVPLTAAAVIVPGADGGSVSDVCGVAVAVPEYPLKLFAASAARTR